MNLLESVNLLGKVIKFKFSADLDPNLPLVLNDTAPNSAEKKTNKKNTLTPNTGVMLQVQSTDVNNHQTE